MKNIQKNSSWIFFWTLVNILFSGVYQYVLTVAHGANNKYSHGPIWGWGSTIKVIVGGTILGVQGALLFFVLDYFFFRKKIQNDYFLFSIRVLLIIVIVLGVSVIQEKYF